MPVSFCSIDWLPIGQDRRQSEESPSIPVQTNSALTSSASIVVALLME